MGITSGIQFSECLNSATLPFAARPTVGVPGLEIVDAVEGTGRARRLTTLATRARIASLPSVSTLPLQCPIRLT